MSGIFETLTPRRNQSGAAMLVALMILVVVSVIGVAAMRSSMFNSKIATSARANTMAFQAAESALAVLFTEASDESEDNTSNIINLIIGQLSHGMLEVIERCVIADGDELFKEGACNAGDRYDSAGFLQASYRLAVNPNPVVSAPRDGDGGGSQISRSGEGGTLYGDYQFVGVGYGSMPQAGIENYNVQEFARRGIVPGDELTGMGEAFDSGMD